MRPALHIPELAMIRRAAQNVQKIPAGQSMAGALFYRANKECNGGNYQAGAAAIRQ